MARPAETPARHRQDVLLLQEGHKGQVVAPRGLGEDIEGPFGSEKFITGLSQHLAKNLPAPGIGAISTPTSVRGATTRCIRAGALTNPRMRLASTRPPASSRRPGVRG